MKELTLCLIGAVLMATTFTLMELEDQTKLTQEQNKLLITYCKALPACKKEMDK